jgi:hypothetical protein
MFKDKNFCNLQDGCSWQHTIFEWECVGQHKPCNTYFNQTTCDRNAFCEWRSE